MKLPTVAWICLLVLVPIALALQAVGLNEWPPVLVWGFAGAIVTALVIIGRDQRRQEKEADTWVDDPRKSALENWMEKRRQRFNPARGLGFFLLGLVAFSIMAGIGALLGEMASIGGAIAFVIIMSVVAGLIGMFTEKVPL